MKAFAVLFWLALSSSVLGQTVVVQSGDHPDFTRLVLELPKQSGWRLGRTDQGYELRIDNEALRFDVASVFASITRKRLAAIWMDPNTGALQFGIGCACYAVPFEFRPGVIVVDLRDGPPPAGSSFERSLGGDRETQLAPRQNRRPQSRPKALLAAQASATGEVFPKYNWLEAQPKTRIVAQNSLPVAPSGLAPKIINTGQFKDTLLRQLSLGAAQGIVQMVQPSLASRAVSQPPPFGPRANIRIGTLQGFQVTTAPAADNTVISEGVACISDATLNLREWGTDTPVATQLADSRTDLVGEFDRPDPVAVIRATKLLLYLGFGAEARQLMAKLPVNDPDQAIFVSLSKLVDGGSDLAGPFAGMQTCDTSVALWAVLTEPQLTASQKPQTEAVLRTFSALPGHLRRSLGPELATKFLAIGDFATARSISNAVQRGMTETPPDVAVMSAEIDLANGEPAKAAAQLIPALAQAGPSTAQTLIALVDSQIAAGEQIDPRTATALAALVREQAGGTFELDLRRAQILALGASGDFDQAFDLLSGMPDVADDLWKILALSGSDIAILNHAVIPPETSMSTVPREARVAIAAKLLTLGLPTETLLWLGPQTATTAISDRILAAAATLSNQDPAATLDWVTGVDDKKAADLRAQSLWKLGKSDKAAQEWAAAGDPAAELRAKSWSNNWAFIAKSGSLIWQDAANLVVKNETASKIETLGPLAQGNALIAQSTAARATLATLLAAVKGPIAGP